MRYSFTGMARAYEFHKLLVSLGLSSSVGYTNALGWHVQTDSRCLAHASRLAPFIYRSTK
jgi:hypothetical protein